MPLYRIEFSIQRQADGEDDFTEVGFGSSGAWSTVTQCGHMVDSAVQCREWETTGGMPDPDSLKGEE